MLYTSGYFVNYGRECTLGKTFWDVDTHGLTPVVFSVIFDNL
jgi:hypothetical protein